MAAEQVRRWDLHWSGGRCVATGPLVESGTREPVLSKSDAAYVIERLHKDCPHTGEWSNPAWHDALDAVAAALDLREREGN